MVKSALLGLVVCVASVATAAVPSTERTALVDLYGSTNGPGWAISTGWLGAAGTECSWYGVVCDGTETHVRQLVLWGNGLVGTLPASLDQLSALEVMDLSDNSITGAIPTTLGGIATLQQLTLYSNQLDGPIPAELGQLAALEVLDLQDNRLVGEVPSELGSLANLRWLYLGTNFLEGELPASLAGLSHLECLVVSGNDLSGPIPDWLGGSTTLLVLWLSGNRFDGPIPDALGQLTQLTALGLGWNRLSGPVPEFLGGLTHLNDLRLNSNRLVGELPASLANLTGITTNSLDLRWNGLWTADASLDAFLDSRQVGGDWQTSQTVAPTGTAAAPLTVEAVGSFWADLSWMPIADTPTDGHYEVLVAPTASGPFRPLASTADGRDKTATGARAAVLEPGTTQYLAVRTVTYPHTFNPKNAVVSEPSAAVAVTTPAATHRFVDAVYGVDGTGCTDPNLPCETLEWALYVAAAGDVVHLAPGTYPIFSLTSLAKDVVIEGAGAWRTAIDGAGFFSPVISVAEGVTAALRGVRVKRGAYLTDTRGSGVTALPGSRVWLEDLEVSDNNAEGVLVDGADVLLTNVTVADNWGSGVDVEEGRASLRNCTVTGNQSRYGYLGEAGGLHATGWAAHSVTASLSASSVSGNGGGISAEGSVRARDSVLLGNSTFNCRGHYGVGSLGHNLVGSDVYCGAKSTFRDVVASDPMLGPLVFNGGRVRTMEPIEASPALGAGDAAAIPAADARRLPRPQGEGTAVGACEQLPSGTFGDVAADYWAARFVEGLAASGVTAGCGGGDYCPEASVTRAQMAVFLLKGEHGPGWTPGPPSGVFADVPVDYWAAAWIEALASEGITAGCGGGLYCPEAEVSRAQMAVFLLKAEHGSGWVPPAPSGVFDDVPVGYWAAAWIEALASEEITAGCGGGNYCPEAPVNRAQMAVFLDRTFRLPW